MSIYSAIFLPSKCRKNQYRSTAAWKKLTYICQNYDNPEKRSAKAVFSLKAYGRLTACSTLCSYEKTPKLFGVADIFSKNIFCSWIVLFIFTFCYQIIYISRRWFCIIQMFFSPSGHKIGRRGLLSSFLFSDVPWEEKKKDRPYDSAQDRDQGCAGRASPFPTIDRSVKIRTPFGTFISIAYLVVCGGSSRPLSAPTEKESRSSPCG